VYLWLTWGTALALTCLLALLVTFQPLLPGEAAIVRLLQVSPLPGAFLGNVVRFLALAEFLLLSGAVLAGILWLTASRRQALILALLLVAMPLSIFGMKQLVERPRPQPHQIEVRVEQRTPSFPSGHSGGATVVYGWLLFLALREGWSKPLRITAGAFSGAMLVVTGPVSLYMGSHWPTDVVAGYSLGLAVLLPAVWAAKAAPLWAPRTRLA
jgi:undecaprenyl-diphosphatase